MSTRDSRDVTRLGAFSAVIALCLFLSCQKTQARNVHAFVCFISFAPRSDL